MFKHWCIVAATLTTSSEAEVGFYFNLVNMVNYVVHRIKIIVSNNLPLCNVM